MRIGGAMGGSAGGKSVVKALPKGVGGEHSKISFKERLAAKKLKGPKCAKMTGKA